jgi:hypothetical protein
MTQPTPPTRSQDRPHSPATNRTVDLTRQLSDITAHGLTFVLIRALGLSDLGRLPTQAAFDMALRAMKAKGIRRVRIDHASVGQASPQSRLDLFRRMTDLGIEVQFARPLRPRDIENLPAQLARKYHRNSGSLTHQPVDRG